MIIILADSPQQLAERYSAILQAIGFNPARFGELADGDVVFCCEHAHATVLWLTNCMDRLDHTDQEREDAISATLQADHRMIERRACVALSKARIGETLTLTDYAAWWVSECAIKEQLDCEVQRRASPMN